MKTNEEQIYKILKEIGRFYCEIGFPDQIHYYIVSDKVLAKHVQPKTDDDCIVLTNKEFKDLKAQRFDNFGVMASPIGDLEISPKGMRMAVDEIKRLKEVEAELQDINAEYYNEAKDIKERRRIEHNMMVHDLYTATQQAHDEGQKRGYDKGRYEARHEVAADYLKFIDGFLAETEESLKAVHKQGKDNSREEWTLTFLLLLRNSLADFSKQYGIKE